MIVYLCALHCEAKPVIDHYRLQKQNHGAFDLYQSDHCACVVSGMGDINMAAASAWAGALFETEAIAWINLGIAGHASLEVGTPTIAMKIGREHSNRPLYPVPLQQASFAAIELISTAAENQGYHESAAYDMEAYAFAQTCSRFSPLELIQCIKIISDNAENPPKRDKAWISQLISTSMPAIADYADQIEALAQAFGLQQLSTHELQRFTALAHFTQTQRSQLKKTLLGLRALDPSLDEAHRLASAQTNARSIMATLEAQLQQHSEVL